MPLDPDHEERAIYLVDGEVEIAGERYEGPRLLIFRPGDRITVKATSLSRMMFLGGDALEGPRQSGGISSPPARSGSSRPRQDWKTGRFAQVPSETRVHSAAGVNVHSAPCFSAALARERATVSKV